MKGLNPLNIMGLYILNAAGEPVACQDVGRWSRWMGKNHGKMGTHIVARDELAHGHRVSTVFLGVDYGYGGLFGGRAPLLYETMVFNDYGELGTDWACARYATRAEALEGHTAALTELKLYLSEKASHG